MIGLIVYVFVVEDLSLRVFVTSIVYSGLFMYLFFELVMTKARPKMQKVIGWLALSFAAVNILLVSRNAEEKKIKIHCRVADDIRIYADKNMMSTIIRNLLSNAIKFTFPDGEVEIGYGLNANMHQLHVKDNGKGIESDNLKKLFKIESGFSTFGTNDEKGTGIGLALCHDFATQHGGNIRVESELGKGTTFYILIPLISKTQLDKEVPAP